MMSTPHGPPAPRWQEADFYLRLAGGFVVLFTAQRLSGYMTLYLYQRLPYDDLVLLAHFFGGAGLIAVCTLGTAPLPFRLRAVPVLRALVDAGWLIGCVLVLLLWWACTPAWRPDTDAGLAIAALLALMAIGFGFRPPRARGFLASRRAPVEDRRSRFALAGLQHRLGTAAEFPEGQSHAHEAGHPVDASRCRLRRHGRRLGVDALGPTPETATPPRRRDLTLTSSANAGGRPRP